MPDSQMAGFRCNCFIAIACNVTMHMWILMCACACVHLRLYTYMRSCMHVSMFICAYLPLTPTRRGKVLQHEAHAELHFLTT